MPLIMPILYGVFRRVSFNPSKPRNYLLAQVLNKLHELRPCFILELVLWLTEYLLKNGHQLRCKLLDGRIVVLIYILLVVA
jgi:hypothetical protein